MQLINEEDDFAVAGGHFLDEGFESFLEFAAVFGTGQHGADVQAHQALALHAFRYVAVHNAAGQAFRNGGLAYAGLTNEYGVILGAAGKNLQHPANLCIAANDRVNLALTGAGGQVGAVFLQGLVFLLRVLVGDALVTTHILQGLQVPSLAQAAVLQNGGEGAIRLENAQHEVLHAQEVIAHGFALLLRGVQHAVQLRPDARALRHTAALPRLAVQLLLQFALQSSCVHTGAGQHGAQHAAFLLYESQ